MKSSLPSAHYRKCPGERQTSARHAALGKAWPLRNDDPLGEMMKQWSGADFEDPYAELPDLYDLEHAGFSDDVELYLRLAEVVGDPILELGCGTGRVLAPLAAAGHRITGIDLSPPMLERARATLQMRAGSLLQRVTL